MLQLQLFTSLCFIFNCTGKCFEFILQSFQNLASRNCLRALKKARFTMAMPTVFEKNAHILQLKFNKLAYYFSEL